MFTEEEKQQLRDLCATCGVAEVLRTIRIDVPDPSDQTDKHVNRVLDIALKLLASTPGFKVQIVTDL